MNASKQLLGKRDFWEGRYGIAVLAGAATLLATAFVIYLTPLKYLNVVPPVMNSMQPSEFHESFTANPDEYVFIDVRSPNIYDSAHAQGSINIPIENLYEEHYSLPKTGKKIALICTTGRLAAIAYGYLKYQGFNNLVHLDGGVAKWTHEGLPLEGRNVLAAPVPDEHQ